jgi:hypothetical protein
MPARIVNEMTYTAWCGECPYSTEPTIYRERAAAAVEAHNAEKHPRGHEHFLPDPAILQCACGYIPCPGPGELETDYMHRHLDNS